MDRYTLPGHVGRMLGRLAQEPGIQGFQGLGLSMLRIRHPVHYVVLCSVVWRFFESRDV